MTNMKIVLWKIDKHFSQLINFLLIFYSSTSALMELFFALAYKVLLKYFVLTLIGCRLFLGKRIRREKFANFHALKGITQD